MKKKVLHVVKWMGRAGLETWLMNVLRKIDRDNYQFDFVVQTDRPGEYDAEIRQLGGRIIVIKNAHNPILFPVELLRVLRRYGPYDVVHSHVHHFSGYVLLLACLAGVPVRIAHSHNAPPSVGGKRGLYRRLYLWLMKRLIWQCATLGLACSKLAAGSLFGTLWEAEDRWKLFYCGIDLGAFRIGKKEGVRAELGLPKGAFVVGHVGRFVEQKNHAFLIRIAEELASRDPNMRVLLVGSGPLQEQIKQDVVERGLSDVVVFTGSRADIAGLMISAMDVFVFPSIFEGLGLVLIEAQAAGLPCVVADSLPDEVGVIGALVRRVSLSAPVSSWVEAICEARRAREAVEKDYALNVISNTSFNVSRNIVDLERYYAIPGSAVCAAHGRCEG